MEDDYEDNTDNETGGNLSDKQKPPPKADLIQSLGVANTVLTMKKQELKTLTDILQQNPRLSDGLVVLLAEFCNMEMRAVDDLNKAIDLIEEEKEVFGAQSLLAKELPLFPGNDYPPNQKPRNILKS